jgi:hypothetical protein
VHTHLPCQTARRCRLYNSVTGYPNPSQLLCSMLQHSQHRTWHPRHKLAAAELTQQVSQPCFACSLAGPLSPEALRQWAAGQVSHARTLHMGSRRNASSRCHKAHVRPAARHQKALLSNWLGKTRSACTHIALTLEHGNGITVQLRSAPCYSASCCCSVYGSVYGCTACPGTKCAAPPQTHTCICLHLCMQLNSWPVLTCQPHCSLIVAAPASALHTILHYSQQLQHHIVLSLTAAACPWPLPAALHTLRQMHSQ